MVAYTASLLISRCTLSEASNQSASASGESPRWPLNSARSGSLERTVWMAASTAASSGKTLSAFQVKRGSTSDRFGSALATVSSVPAYDFAMPRASANGIEIEYETFGDAAAPPLLLVMGLGAQMISWD